MLATARDHKRAFDGDRGPNTGGMGALSPADNWNAERENEFDAQIMRPLLSALSKRAIQYHGLLFPGLMVTDNGLRVLEFNCRFGDPETQAILPRLRSDLLPLLIASIDGDLENVRIEIDSRVSVTVILASGGYPEKYETGKRISGLERAAKMPGVQIFHAATRREGDEIVSTGGRVLAVTAVSESIERARAQAYAGVEEIHFEGCHFRRDIALPLSRK